MVAPDIGPQNVGPEELSAFSKKKNPMVKCMLKTYAYPILHSIMILKMPTYNDIWHSNVEQGGDFKKYML